MKIYLAQHAESVDKAVDPERPISPSGAETTANVAKRLTEKRIEISAVRHSGKLRARQTAEIFAKYLEVSDVSEVQFMNPMDDIKGFVNQLQSNGTLYIGHLPHLDKSISHLLRSEREQGVLKFRNSAVACIELNDGAASLAWYLTPEIC